MKTPVSMGQIELDINTVLVEDQSTAALFERAGYYDIDAGILNATTLIHKPGPCPMAIWSPRRDISSEVAEKTMGDMTTVISGKTYKGRPAIIQGLVSYEVVFHKLLGNTIVVALGEKLVFDSRNYAVYRHTNSDGSRRMLSRNYWTDGWNANCHFLVEFEEVIAE